MARALMTILTVLFCASCNAQNVTLQRAPAQCFVLTAGSEANVRAALISLSKRLELQVDLSDPSDVLLRDRTGAARILMMYAPPEFGTLLVSYEDSSGKFVDLEAAPEPELQQAISSRCPKPSENFSPPTIYE